MKTKSPRRQFGLTLVESMLSAAIVTVTVGIAAPGFDQFRERQEAQAAAAQFETDVQLARSLAVMQHRSVRLSFGEPEGASCYVIHTGPAKSCRCDGDGRATCDSGAEPLRVANFGARSRVQLKSNSSTMVFDETKATVTPTATVKILVRGDAVLHQVINIMGRTRTCSPAGVVAGHPRCT